MGYDNYLAERIGRILKEKKIRFESKKMMGGLCYLINDKMCVGIIDNKLMARIHPDVYEASLKRKGCKVMDFTGKPMKGYVFVEGEGIDADKDLNYWVQLALDFNPLAKSSKKKKIKN